MKELIVTLVVIPRERFSYTAPSLENIYENTNFPFKLIYVDGNSPPKTKQYLKAQSEEKKFELIRIEKFLSPNQARNIGLSHVDTKYVVFIDNDILVKPGWLEKLVECAEETNASLVGPLCLEGSDFQTIHMVGGTSVFREKGALRWLVEKRPFMGQPLEKVKAHLKRQSTGILELHCILARTELFQTIGPFDEKLLSMGEESDICMCTLKANGSIYIEPDSVISYVPPRPPDPLQLSDLPYFFVRWSRTWGSASVEHFGAKWNLTDDSPTLKHFLDFSDRHRSMGYKIFPKYNNRVVNKALFIAQRLLTFPVRSRSNDLASNLARNNTN
jgi:glycosyltransferase involved in cell wall biosynthesis